LSKQVNYVGANYELSFQALTPARNRWRWSSTRDFAFCNPTHENLPPFLPAIILACLKTLSINEAARIQTEETSIASIARIGPSFPVKKWNAYLAIEFQERIYKISYSTSDATSEVFATTPLIEVIQIMTNLSKVEQKARLEAIIVAIRVHPG